MKGLWKYLSPFAPDQSGATAVLCELDGLTIIIDAGGCAGNICGFDEPRWFDKRSAIFSAGLRDMDAILGRDDRLIAKINRICDTYTAGAKYIRKNPRVILRIFLLTTVQRLCQFAVTWVVYRAYGLNSIRFVDILALQIMIAVAAEMLPLPGAAGITEGCFLLTFTGIFGEDLVRPALLLSRGLTYYLVLIAGGIVTFAAHTALVLKERKKEE